MSEELKQAMIGNGCAEHIEEFGDCIGVVDGLLDYGTFQGPEVDVRWQPSNLRYGYNPDDLVVVGEKQHRSIDDNDERKTRQDSPLLKSRLALRARMKLRPT
jgi:hypothetical protein